MTTKLPFIKPYLEDFLYDNSNSNSELRRLLNDNKCKIIMYSQITEYINLENYDFIVIIGKDEIIKMINENSYLFNKYKNKLFFVSIYSNPFSNNNVVTKIKTGFVVDPYKKYKFHATNLTQNICLSADIIKSNYVPLIIKNCNFVLKNLTSSIKQLDVSIYIPKEYNIPYINIPNKMKIINITSCIGDIAKQKIPLKTILIIKIRLTNSNINTVKKLYKMSSYMMFVNISQQINHNNSSSQKMLVDKNFLIKNKNKTLVIKNKYTYISHYNEQNITNMCKEVCIKTQFREHAWKIMTNEFFKHAHKKGKPFHQLSKDDTKIIYSENNVKFEDILLEKFNK